MSTATLGSLVMHGDSVVPDTDGDIFTYVETEGWESPEVELQITERTGDGDFIPTGRYAKRSLVVKGHAKCPYYGQYHRLRKKIIEASNLVHATGLFKLLEPDSGITKQLTVLRAAPPRIARVGPYVVQFEIPLVAADPRKYRDSTSSQNIVIGAGNSSNFGAVVNAGDYPTYPTITITGTGTNPKLTNSDDGGKYVQIDFVSGGNTIVIDFARKLVTIDGVSHYEYVDALTQFWQLVAGSNTVTFARTGTTSTMTAAIVWRDAWI